MPKYQIKTSSSNDYIIEYTFASIKAAKKYFCNKILALNYDDGDGFSVSSKYFEEMGVLLSKYSNEKCYAINSLELSIHDLAKWGNYKHGYDGETNKEMVGKYFSESIHNKCEQLLNKLNLHVTANNDIYMPNVCCEAKSVEEPSSFHCSNELYSEMLTTKIGCSNLEGACEGNYDTFQSDL